MLYITMITLSPVVLLLPTFSARWVRWAEVGWVWGLSLSDSHSLSLSLVPSLRLQLQVLLITTCTPLPPTMLSSLDFRTSERAVGCLRRAQTGPRR